MRVGAYGISTIFPYAPRIGVVPCLSSVSCLEMRVTFIYFVFVFVSLPYLRRRQWGTFLSEGRYRRTYDRKVGKVRIEAVVLKPLLPYSSFASELSRGSGRKAVCICVLRYRDLVGVRVAGAFVRFVTKSKYYIIFSCFIQSNSAGILRPCRLPPKANFSSS